MEVSDRPIPPKDDRLGRRAAHCELDLWAYGRAEGGVVRPEDGMGWKSRSGPEPCAQVRMCVHLADLT